MQTETETTAYPRIAEYGQFPGAPRAIRTVHEIAWSPLVRANVSLGTITEGYAVAGSCLRWDAACWSVQWDDNRGAIQGRRFLRGDASPAREFFARLIADEEG